MSETIDYRCPTHGTPLLYTLKGGAGFCAHPLHRMYVQAAGVTEPELDEWVRLKRSTSAQPKKKTSKLTSKKTSKPATPRRRSATKRPGG